MGSDHNYSNIAIHRLAPYLPTTFRKLRIACEVSADDLKDFFDKCQVPIEELSIPNLYNLCTNRHLEVVRDHIKEKGTLKDFDFTYCQNISPELWEELKEISEAKTRCFFDPFYYPTSDLFNIE